LPVASFIWFAKTVAAINKSSDSINIPRFLSFDKYEPPVEHNDYQNLVLSCY
jgi:hypothetical protein